MIICLYGRDSYRRSEKLREVVASYKNKNSQADLLFADLEEEREGWRRVRDFLVQPSMFATKKMAVVTGATGISETEGFGKEEAKEWRRVLKGLLEGEDTFIVVVQSDKPQKSYAFLAKEPVRSQEFQEFSGDKLALFIKKEADKHGVIFGSEAIRYFINYLMEQKDRSFAAVLEIEKLSLFKQGEPISVSDLKSTLNWVPKNEAFKLALSFLRARDTKERLMFLEAFLIQDEEPRYIFNLLGSLARGREAVELSRYDEMVKGGELDDEAALTAFAVGKS